MAVSLLFTTPIDAPRGTTERRLPLHGPRPGPPPRNFQKNSRPPAGNSLDRNSPGLRPGKKRAGLRPGPTGQGKNCRNIEFCRKGKKRRLKKNIILVPWTTEIDLGTLIFGISASNYMGSRSSRPNPCPEDPFRGQSKVPPKAG